MSQSHSVHHKSHKINLGANPGFLGKKPTTNSLSYGPALLWKKNNVIYKKNESLPLTAFSYRP
jgi:hypothetical protein